MEYDEEKNCLWMHQRQYINSLLDRYGLSQAKTSPTPADTNVKLVNDDGISKPVDPVKYQSMVGSLLYAAIATRPDIAQALGAVSKYNFCPTESHLTAVKRIFYYLKGTTDIGLRYQKCDNGTLIGFSDVDWAGDRDNRHSTTGNLFVMSGGAISWFSRKQSVVDTILTYKITQKIRECWITWRIFMWAFKPFIFWLLLQSVISELNIYDSLYYYYYCYHKGAYSIF